MTDNLISDISNFKFEAHPKILDLFNKITVDKEITRNGAIFEILTSGLTDLEIVVLALNLGEFKGKEIMQEQFNAISKNAMRFAKEMVGLPTEVDLESILKQQLDKNKKWMDEEKELFGDK